MSVKIKGLREFKTRREKLLSRMGGEVSRIVTRSRNATTKETLKRTKTGNIVNSRMTFKRLGKYIHSLGRDPVTVRSMLRGFRRTQNISSLPISLSYLNLKFTLTDKRKSGAKRNASGQFIKGSGKARKDKRYRVSLVIGGKTEEYPGVFLVAKGKYIPRPGRQRFLGFAREGRKPYPLKQVHGPGLSTLLTEIKADKAITQNATRTWHEQLRDRLGRVIGRFR